MVFGAKKLVDVGSENLHFGVSRVDRGVRDEGLGIASWDWGVGWGGERARLGWQNG